MARGMFPMGGPQEADLFLADLLGIPTPRRRSVASFEELLDGPESPDDAELLEEAEPPGPAAAPAPAAAPPTPAALRAVCARDVSVTDDVALLVADHAPLPVTGAEAKRIAGNAGARDDYKAVCAIVPSAPEERLLVYFHGNNNFVTVAPSTGVPPRAVSRPPRWADPRGMRAAAAGRAAPLKYGFDALAHAQRDLSAPALASLAVKDPVVLVPEDAERTDGGYWCVPPRRQYGIPGESTRTDSGTARLQELVMECYEHLRCLPTPSGRTYLAPEMGNRASFIGNVRRMYLSGHSGGGKPLLEAAGADLVLPSPSSVAGVGGRAAELWLYDCTYGFGIASYVSFVTRWQEAGLLAYRPDAARLVCVYRPRDSGSNTESEADELRRALARVLKVSASSLLRLHDSTDMSSASMLRDVVPALVSAPVLFVRTHVAHDRIPTLFTPLLLRSAAS